MAYGGMYCLLCDCIQGKEPCLDCVNSNFQCIWKCICCAEYRKKNIILVQAKRRAANIIEDIEDDNNNGYDANMQHLQTRNGEEFYSTGPATSFPNLNCDPQSSGSTYECSESLRENGAVSRIKRERLEVGDSSYSDLEELRLSLQLSGDLGTVTNFEDTEYISPFDFWASDSRVSQLRSLEKYLLNDPKEGRQERRITNDPRKCDSCACLPEHVSCRSCIFWDSSCTYPIGSTRCTCCETFENSLDELSDYSDEN